jgi:hypothetical protein
MPDRGRQSTARQGAADGQPDEGPGSSARLDGPAARTGDEDSTGRRRLAGGHVARHTAAEGEGHEGQGRAAAPAGRRGAALVLRGRRDRAVLDLGVLQDVADRAASPRARAEAPSPRRRAAILLAIVLPRISPYSLRHSFGTEAVRRTNNLLGVQTLMLHARLSTTERYLKSALEQSAQAVIEKWGGRRGAAS